MVNRRQCGSLYAQYKQACNGGSKFPYLSTEQKYLNANHYELCGKKMYQDGQRNKYANCSNFQMCENYSKSNACEPKDYRHACSICPGDFSHTSCKYCLNETEENIRPESENSTEDWMRYLDHEPRINYRNNCYGCMDSMYFDENPSSNFYNNRRHFKRSISPSREDCCEFCFKNGETPVIYGSHRFRNPSGTIACPLLKKDFCSYEFNGFEQCGNFEKCGCYDSRSENEEYLTAPLYRSKQYYERPIKQNPTCRCYLGVDGTFSTESVPKFCTRKVKNEFCRYENGKRLHNGLLTKQEYFDLPNFT